MLCDFAFNLYKLLVKAKQRIMLEKTCYQSGFKFFKNTFIDKEESIASTFAISRNTDIDCILIYKI